MAEPSLSPAQNPAAAGVQPTTLQGNPPIRNFSFLKHFWKLAVVGAFPTLTNPGFLTDTGVTETSPGLKDSLDQVMSDYRRRRAATGKPDLDALRFALVDLSDGRLKSPEFAANNPTQQGGVGSTAKLGVMIAAFQLRFDLNRFAEDNPSITAAADLFSALRAEWAKTQILSSAPVVKVLHPGDSSVPHMELRDRLVSIDPTFDRTLKFPLPLPTPASVPDLSNAPNLEKIFTQATGSGLKFDFQGSVSNTPGVAKHTSQTPDNLAEVRKLSFGERLFEMIDDSDNAASQSCVEDIGYLFINSCLWQCDFFNPQRQGGLWIGSAFLDKKARWIETPVPDRKQGPGNSFTACTPATIAAIMTLIAQDRMISPEASQEMRALLSKRKSNPSNGSHTRSFLEDGLKFADPANEVGTRFQLQEVFSKLGIGTRRSDAIIVKRQERGKTLHYVAAGFDDVPSAAGLHELALQLDMAIQKNNGLQPSPVPLP